MARRFGDASLRRGGGGGGGSGSPGIQTFASILGPLYVDEWDRAITASAASWTSVNGRVLPATGSPTYAADAGFFNNGSVLQTTAVGACFRGTSLTALAPAGSMPWIGVVCRLRTASGNTWLTSFGGADPQYDQVCISSGATLITRFRGGAADVIRAYTDGVVHLHEQWLDGSNWNSAIDGVVLSSASAATIAEDLTSANVGSDSTGAGGSDSSFSRVIVASSVPSPTQRASILALARHLDGF